MRIAAIGDVHGNLPALEAVMDEICTESVDGIVVCGDTIAGPLPTETVAVLQESRIPVHFLRGNHDSDVVRFLSGQEPGGMAAKDDDAARWEASKLTREQKASLLTWPATVEIESEPWGKILFCHATPHNETFVFSRLTPEAKLLSVFERLNVSLMVCAHTHMQFDRTIADVRVVNTGSLGMCVGRTGADWLLIDDEIQSVSTPSPSQATELADAHMGLSGVVATVDTTDLADLTVANKSVPAMGYSGADPNPDASLIR